MSNLKHHPSSSFGPPWSESNRVRERTRAGAPCSSGSVFSGPRALRSWVLCAGLALTLTACRNAPDRTVPGPPLLLITLEEAGDPPTGEALEILNEGAFRWSWSAIASSPRVATALGSLHTGLRPWQHGALDGQTALHPGCETLALTLKALGYETLAYADRALRLERLGFARGYSRFGALRSGKRALIDVEALQPNRFVWIHVRFDPRRGAAQQWRRARGVLEAAERSPSWPETVVAVVGVTGPGADGLDRRSLSVPLYLRTPANGTAAQRTPASTSPVAAARLYETLNELAGGEPLPATAASLLDMDAEAPLFSASYGQPTQREGWRRNEFSLVEGELQLLWRAAVSPSPRSLPLSGSGNPRLELRRWADPPDSVERPEVRDAMALRLRRAWLSDLDGEEPMQWRPLDSNAPAQEQSSGL